MKSILALLLLAPFIAISQENKGIRFEKGLTWEQVKAKAKSQNKFIFVDCYATWCGPCNVMDKEIYTIDSIGEYFNAHFVSIKVQMDKTTRDTDSIRVWYEDAVNFRKKYNVDAYPTFLFFSPEGEIIHKSVGFQPGRVFLQASKDALDPSNQYYSLVKKFYENQDNRELLKRSETAIQLDKNPLVMWLTMIQKLIFYINWGI